MKAVTPMNSNSSSTIRTKVKKETKSTKAKPNRYSVVHPETRKQMIEEAAYFKALNREFEGDSCDEDWLDAETEIDASLDDGTLDDHNVEDWQETEEDADDTRYCG